MALAPSLLETGKAEGILSLGRDLHIKMLPSLCPPFTPAPCLPTLAFWASGHPAVSLPTTPGLPLVSLLHLVLPRGCSL